MTIINETFTVGTNKRNQLIDITSQVGKKVSQSGISNGQVIVFCPHTTAGITINENADPSVVDDIVLTLNELFPENRKGYRHSEGNSDSHVKSSVIGISETIIIQDSQLRLGTWQGIYFCEFDGPRSRKVYLQIKGQ